MATVVAVLAAAAPAQASSPFTAYVANHDSGTVSPIDLGRGTAGAPIAVGGSPTAVVFSPDGRTAWAATEAPSALVPIDVGSDTAAAPIPIAVGAPSAAAISPDGRTAYVATGAAVTPVDLVARTAGTPITVVGGASAVAFTPDGGTAFVANPLGDAVTPITVASGTTRPPIPLGAGDSPSALAVTPGGRRLFVAGRGRNRVLPVDVASGAVGAPVDVAAGPTGLGMAPDGATVYAASPAADRVTPVDVAGGGAREPIVVPGGPASPVVSPDGRLLYVVNSAAASATRIVLPGGSQSSLSTGAAPSAFAYAPDQAPTAAFTAFLADPGKGSLFDARGSSSPVGGIAAYLWDYGDGATQTTDGAFASHAYARPGAYRVRLQVVNGLGTSTDTVYTGQAAIRAGAPRARTEAVVTVTPAAPVDGRTPNSFRFPIVKRAADGTLRITFLAQFAGRITARVTTARPRGKGRFTYGTGRRTATRLGTFLFRVKPGKQARALIKTRRRQRVRTKVELAVTWTPQGGTALTKRRTLSLRTDRRRGAL